MAPDSIKLERGDTIVFIDLRISFRKTEKLPDHQLDAPPVQHNSHTLFPVSHYSERLPKDFAANRGVILEMLQSEGMVVTFESIKPYFIRVYTEDTNVIFGRPVFQESRDDRHRRNTTRHDWQNKQHPEEPFQNYIIVPAQKRLEGFTTRAGHLHRFRPTVYPENTTITQHLEEHVTFSALRFDITPFNMNATYWLHNMGWHSTLQDDGKYHFTAFDLDAEALHILLVALHKTVPYTSDFVSLIGVPHSPSLDTLLGMNDIIDHYQIKSVGEYGCRLGGFVRMWFEQFRPFARTPYDELWDIPSEYGDGEEAMMWASLAANFQPRSATGVTLEHAVWNIIYAAGHNVVKTPEGLVETFGYPLRQDEMKRVCKALRAEEVVRYVNMEIRCPPKWDSIFDAPGAGTPVVEAPTPKIPLT